MTDDCCKMYTYGDALFCLYVDNVQRLQNTNSQVMKNVRPCLKPSATEISLW